MPSAFNPSGTNDDRAPILGMSTFVGVDFGSAFVATTCWLGGAAFDDAAPLVAACDEAHPARPAAVKRIPSIVNERFTENFTVFSPFP